MRFFAGKRELRGLVALLALLTAPAPSQQPPALAAAAAASQVTLHYGIEWRLVRAGVARIAWDPLKEQLSNARLNIESAGLVSKLYPVDDRYVASFNTSGCTSSVWLQAREGSRKRETNITFDHANNRANYVERDLEKDKLVLSTQLTIPDCPYDILGALYHLRKLHVEPGQATQITVTDGKKLVSARVEAQEREVIKTPLGTYRAIRYEAFLFNNVLYQRKGRLFIWLTDDDRRLPVQFRVQLQLHIGTLTFQLEKEEKS